MDGCWLTLLTCQLPVQRLARYPGQGSTGMGWVSPLPRLGNLLAEHCHGRRRDVDPVKGYNGHQLTVKLRTLLQNRAADRFTTAELSVSNNFGGCVTNTGRSDCWPVDMRSRKAHRASRKSVSGRGPGAESSGQR